MEVVGSPFFSYVCLLWT